MEFKLRKEVVEAAAKAPKVFVEASLGGDGQYNRAPGIQLTKEQVISLRRYEMLGLSLPQRLTDVISYLNYGAGDAGRPGLTPMDFLGTFTTTYDHARRWSPLREKIQLTGADLQGFARIIVGRGAAISEVYGDLRSSRYLEEHNITTIEEYLKLKVEIPHLPDLALPSGDIREIKFYLNSILDGVKSRHVSAEAVRRELDSFGTDMREKVLPRIKLRLKAVTENPYEDEIRSIQEDIDQRAAEIDELNNQYDAMVKEAIVAAATLNVGGLIMGIYQGVQAENIRKKRNELKSTQDTAIAKLGSKHQTLSSLNRVRGDLQNLSAVTIEAEVATQNLMLVWNSLSQFIEDSLKTVDEVHDAVSLRSFHNSLKLVVEPWGEDIGPTARALNAIFEEAQREIDAGNLIRTRSVQMYSLSSGVDYPQINIRALYGYNSNVQTAKTQTQFLAERHDYLPAVVGRMTGLATAIDSQTFNLRNTAQSALHILNRTNGRLERYQDELEEPGSESDKQEVRYDMEKALRATSGEISQQVDNLKQIELNLSARYDREASKQWTLALLQDRTFVEEQKDKAEAKRVELLEQVASVSNAIELIGRNGVEKIGQEAQLTVESLMAMGMAPPQMQVALLAMDTLKKTIAGIGETLSYLNMVAGRDRLRDRAHQLMMEAGDRHKELSEVQGKIDLVESLDRLDSVRWDYLKEFGNVVAAYEKFSKAFAWERSRPVEENVRNARALIPGFTQYLRPILQP
ncbi:alpha-xenorhabdolysin family binary toxin subunit A [Pseudomonas sp. D3-10]|uniref:alpha-xenorhabdolysin family binary toxin subunit A n=1 Tax=Pseudomonas sp. D3-10 TaxID=2817392 RepID=UPI003DA8B0C0